MFALHNIGSRSSGWAHPGRASCHVGWVWLGGLRRCCLLVWHGSLCFPQQPCSLQVLLFSILAWAALGSGMWLPTWEVETPEGFWAELADCHCLGSLLLTACHRQGRFRKEHALCLRCWRGVQFQEGRNDGSVFGHYSHPSFSKCFRFPFWRPEHIASFKLVFILKHKLEHELHICLPFPYWLKIE